jgi:hypothetical protein
VRYIGFGHATEMLVTAAASIVAWWSSSAVRPIGGTVASLASRSPSTDTRPSGARVACTGPPSHLFATVVCSLVLDSPCHGHHHRDHVSVHRGHDKPSVPDVPEQRRYDERTMCRAPMMRVVAMTLRMSTLPAAVVKLIRFYALLSGWLSAWVSPLAPFGSIRWPSETPRPLQFRRSDFRRAMQRRGCNNSSTTPFCVAAAS